MANYLSTTIIGKILEKQLHASLMEEARSLIEPKLKEVVNDLVKDMEVNAEVYLDQVGFGEQILRIIVQDKRS